MNPEVAKRLGIYSQRPLRKKVFCANIVILPFSSLRKVGQIFTECILSLYLRKSGRGSSATKETSRVEGLGGPSCLC